MGGHVPGQPVGLDAPVHCASHEAHARGDADGEAHADVVVLDVHVAALTGPALVGSLALPGGIHRADRDPSRVLHDLHLHRGRIAAPGLLDRGDLHPIAHGGRGLDVAVDALDLDALPRGHAAVPAPVLGVAGGGDAHERGDERRLTEEPALAHRCSFPREGVCRH